MTREEFIEILDKKGYFYREEGDKIVVTRTKPTGFGNIHLESLETLPSGVVFDNWGYVYLDSLKTIPQGVEFKNGGYVSLASLIGGRFGEWYGNIKGIDGNRLLNKMIELGLFDR